MIGASGQQGMNWLGALSGHSVMLAGHVLMFTTMAVAMLRRREEYLDTH